MMHPVEPQSLGIPAITINGQALPTEPEPVQMTQPRVVEPMVLERPASNSNSAEPDLRGGERSQMCPGRFCFIIPCPLPCDFCIC